MSKYDESLLMTLPRRSVRALLEVVREVKILEALVRNRADV